MSIHHPHLKVLLLNSLRLRSQSQLTQQGFTLIEALLVVAVVGILAAISAPMWMERPLRAGAQQSGSLFRQVRLRAMSNTTAFRIRPDLNSLVPGTQQATRYLVQASTGRSCGATTNISTVTPPTENGSSSTLPVTSIAGFSPSDRITIGESTTTYEVTATNSGNPQIIVGNRWPGQQGTALLGAEVELASTWNSGGQFTGLISDQLQLASSTSEAVTIPTQVTANGQSIPWSLCYSAQGLALLFNARTGQVVNADLELPIISCANGSNCTGSGRRGSTTMRITRGGAVTVPTTIN
jgi:prepilin-type N-terminal cleavage/methylation domain-containing protein